MKSSQLFLQASHSAISQECILMKICTV